MKHRVTVRTHGAKIVHRIDRVGFFRFRDWFNVVNVNEFVPNFPKVVREIEPADHAAVSVME